MGQGGVKHKGSFAMYLEPWHADVFDFLELRKAHGKEEQRAHDLFYGLWVPDLYTRRVKNSDWTLFCPDEAYDAKTGKGHIGVWGDEFERLYTQREADGKGHKMVKAQQLWFRIFEAQMETGTPYMLCKDHASRKSNQHLGTIHSTNLGAEITERISFHSVRLTVYSIALLMVASGWILVLPVLIMYLSTILLMNGMIDQFAEKEDLESELSKSLTQDFGKLPDTLTSFRKCLDHGVAQARTFFKLLDRGNSNSEENLFVFCFWTGETYVENIIADEPSCEVVLHMLGRGSRALICTRPGSGWLASRRCPS